VVTPEISSRYEVNSNNDAVLGAFAEIDLPDGIGFFKFQPEFFKIIKGFKIDDTQGVKTSTTYNLSYFELPLLVKGRFNLIFMAPFVFIGPNIAMLTKAEREISAPGFSEKKEVTDFFAKFDLAVDIGGGIELTMLPIVSPFVSARYSHGLINIANDSFGNNVRTRGVQLLGGLKVSL
jgi:hypothetical protein